MHRLENNAVSSVADSSNPGRCFVGDPKTNDDDSDSSSSGNRSGGDSAIPYSLRIRSTHLHPQPLAVLALVQALVVGNLVLLVDEGSVSVLAIASAITPLSTGRWIERIGRGAGEAYFMTAIVAMSCGM
jgi:hypothetical protein